jgi:hypothetical protein
MAGEFLEVTRLSDFMKQEPSKATRNLRPVAISG